jgi:GntR family transcriptional regulator, transcriptional repressor for pyruvate dehydrogenase complex
LTSGRADAIVAGDPARARQAAQELLGPATTALLAAIENLEDQR